MVFPVSRLRRPQGIISGNWTAPPYTLPTDWQFDTSSGLFSRKASASWDYSFNLAGQTGTVRTVTSGSFSDLQTKITSAVRGDIIVVPVATYTGNLTLPAKTGVGWIYVVSEKVYNGTFPKLPGQRVLPTDASSMPTIVGNTTNTPTIVTASSSDASFYRFVGLEVTHQSAVSVSDGLFRFGYSGITQLSEMPHHHVVDRCYIHGTPTSTIRRGVVMNCASGAVLDCYISDIKEVGADNQAFSVWNGAGPFDVINCYLEAACENQMIGGSDPSITNLVPADITFSRCHFKKQMAWKTSSWSVKNIFELKNARRVLCESSVLENFWVGGQAFALQMTPVNQDGTAPWSTVQDVTLRYLKFINCEQGINTSNSTGTGGRWSFEHVLFDKTSMVTGSNQGMIQVGSNPQDLFISHITGFPGDFVFQFVNGIVNRIAMQDIIAGHGLYGIRADGDGEGNSAINGFATNFTSQGNIWIGSNSGIYPVGSPVTNKFPADTTAVGFVDYASGNYRLAANSPYKGLASDAKDPGCDIDFVEERIAGVGDTVITGFSIDNTSLNRFANVSDIWPTTVGDDGNIYTSGNDGNGWDGVDTRGWDLNRLSGAVLTNPAASLSANGTEVKNKTDVYSKGLISVGGTLYIAEQDRTTSASLRLGHSTDHGATWTYPAGAGWDYQSADFRFCGMSFVMHDPDNSGALDNYVYMVAPHSDDGSGSPYDRLEMARVPKATVDQVATHEYLTGFDARGNPQWSSVLANVGQMFRRTGEIHWGPTINYNAVLKRYLLCFFINSTATLAVYEGPKPWGPWTLVTEIASVGGDTTEKFMVNFVSRTGWLSSDGLTWWFVTSGLSAWDSFNVLKATLTIT